MPISAIPLRVVDAFLAAEDKNFYSHPGIDLPSIMRAVFTNFLAMAHVLIRKFLGRRQRQRLLFVNGLTLRHGRANVVHRVDGIHGGRPGRKQSAGGRIEFLACLFNGSKRP